MENNAATFAVLEWSEPPAAQKSGPKVPWRNQLLEQPGRWALIRKFASDQRSAAAVYAHSHGKDPRFAVVARRAPDGAWGVWACAKGGAR